MLQSFSKNLAEFFEKESAPDTMVAVSIALLQPDIKFEIKVKILILFSKFKTSDRSVA